MLTKTTTTLVIIGLMAALSFAAIATVVNPAAAALPSGPPANRGTATAGCASTQQGPGAQGCAIRGP
jgi:hypothetical protein